MTTILELDGISKQFKGDRRTTIQVLNDITFNVERGEFVCFFGPNGAGKTTLMNIISGLIDADAGTAERHLIRSNIVPTVFQDYRRSLLPWATAGDNITFPLKLNGASREERESKLTQLMMRTGIEIDVDARIDSLSGGQAQMVSILRGLIVEPEIIIFDEPFSALDFQARILLQDRLMALAHEMELTVLFISHDLDEAIYLADRTIFLSARPASIVGEVVNTMPRPRRVNDQTTSQFARLKEEGLRLFQLTIDEGTE